MKFAVGLFLAGTMAHGVFAQEPPAPRPSPATEAPASKAKKSEAEPQAEVSVQDTTSTFKLRVNLVQVHVVVRGDGDKPVDGLHKEDFQLYDNGKLQTISTFAVENDQSRKERTEAALKTQVNNEENTAQVSGAAPERFIALTFDDRHLLTSDVAPLTKAAVGFIDSIGPADRVGIFTTSGLLTQDFTSDKELLKQVLGVRSRTPVNWVSYGMASSVTAESHPEPDILQLPASLKASSNAVKEEGDADIRIELEDLGKMLRLLGSKPGERVLLLASPGFILPVDLRFVFFWLVDQASRSDVIINTLDARGLYTPDLLGDISQPGSDSPQTVGQAASARLEEQFEQQFVLMDFAYATGGRFFHNSNDLEGGLKQLGNAPEVSYVLGFSPQNPKLDGHFHTIKVTVTGKPKYAIEARRGYFAPKKVDDPREAAKQEIQEAVLSQNEIFDLPMSLQTQYFKNEDAGWKLSVVSHLDVRKMKFRKTEGRNFDDVTVATVVFDDNGEFVMGGEKFVKMRLLDASIERMGHTGFVVKSTFDLKAGKYLVRQVVQDSEGAQMAARSAIVVIPD
ncbi:MAG: VWA domain-containing protein [Candidatus Acidiferrum sp.]